MSNPTAEQMVELQKAEAAAMRAAHEGTGDSQDAWLATTMLTNQARIFDYQSAADDKRRVAELEKHNTAVTRICEVNDEIAWSLVDLFDPELRGESPLLALKRLIPELQSTLAARDSEVKRLREALEFAKEAIRVNLKMYAYKNEPLLLEAFNRTDAALAPPADTKGETT